MTSSLAVLVPLLIVLLAGTGSAQEAAAPIVGSYRATVSAHELEEWARFSDRDPGPDRELLLRELVLARTLAAESVRLGLDREPEVSLELERLAFKQARAALRRHLYAEIDFTDEEVEAKYQAIKNTYTRPRRLRLRNLFKRYPPDASDADRAAVRTEMERIRARLEAGTDFAELAAEESDSQTRLQGGLLGNVRPGQLRPAIDAVAMAMKPGELSPILEEAEGLTLLYCEQVLEKVVRSPEELREIARNLLANRAFDRAWSELDEDLRRRAVPEIGWELLVAPGTEPGAEVVSSSAGPLTLGEVEALAATPATQLLEMPRERLVDRVESFLSGRLALREAYARGLELDQNRLELERRRLLATRALAHLIEDRLVPPSPTEIEAYYRANGEELTRPRHYRLTVLSLPLGEGDPRPAYRLGERLLHDVRSGEITLEAAGRAHSQHASAADGGDVGWVSRWGLPHRFGIDLLRAVLRLEVGETSGLVADGRSLWIVRLDGVEEERRQTLEEAWTEVERLLGNRKVRELETVVVDDWLARLAIEPAADPKRQRD